MNSMIMSALAAFGIAGFFGAPSSADVQKSMGECCAKRIDDCCSMKPDNCCEKMKDECCTWTSVYDGKRTHRLNHCIQDEKFKAPGTVRIEVKPEDRRPGDIEGFKTVGKQTEKVWYRDVERKAGPAVDSTCTSKDGCNYSFFTMGKRIERRSFCEQNYQRAMCGEKSGECGTCRK